MYKFYNWYEDNNGDKSDDNTNVYSGQFSEVDDNNANNCIVDRDTILDD